MYAIASLLVVLAVSLLITRVATVILVATGMSGEAARFQARSAFTGAGFTTSESEAVTSHPLRRRVVMILMLLGNVGIVASASSLIIGFKGGGPGASWVRIIELAAGLLVLVYLSRSPWVSRHLAALIGRLLRDYTDLPTRDYASLLDLRGDHSVSELAVEPEDWVAGGTLNELGLREEGVVVLGINRPDGGYLGAPDGATRVQADDVVILYGLAEAVRAIDERKRGPLGDAEHERAVAAHRGRLASE